MDRCRVFVVTYSVVLIAVFCVFCYLISTVEPPPLSDHQHTDDLDNQYDDVVIFDKRSMLPGDTRFTLKKLDAGEKTTELNSHGLYKYETRRVSPPIMPPPEIVDMFNNRNTSLFHKILFAKQTLNDATQIAGNNSTHPKLR